MLDGFQIQLLGLHSPHISRKKSKLFYYWTNSPEIRYMNVKFNSETFSLALKPSQRFKIKILLKHGTLYVKCNSKTILFM